MNNNHDIIVYHGSISLINTIDVTKGKPYKDFGRGFYVTESKSHASNLALRNKRIEKERYGKSCDALLYTYKMNKTILLPKQIYFSNNDAAHTLIPEGQVERL